MLSIIMLQSCKINLKQTISLRKNVMEKCIDNHPWCLQIAPCQKLSRVPNMVRIYAKVPETTREKQRFNPKMSLERTNYIFPYSSLCRDPRGHLSRAASSCGSLLQLRGCRSRCRVSESRAKRAWAMPSVRQLDGVQNLLHDYSRQPRGLMTFSG